MRNQNVQDNIALCPTCRPERRTLSWSICWQQNVNKSLGLSITIPIVKKYKYIYASNLTVSGNNKHY